tara:strand:- start:932 stop:1234 length:303 start_codon:yes stop_codon:yes gene_type:complete
MKNTVFTTAKIATVAVTLLTGAALSLSSTAAFADDDYCNAPKADWQSIDALKEKLTADGWDIRKIKEDDGCYEVYAIKPDGKKIEAYFNPASFEIVKEGD